MNKRRKHRNQGFTLVELLVVLIIIGILVSIPVGRFLIARDRAFVSTAVFDVDLFRKALAIYEADYGRYLNQNYGGVPAIVQDLVDPQGLPYMSLPTGSNFSNFTYNSLANGQTYEIHVTARDNSRSLVEADPDGTTIQN